MYHTSLVPTDGGDSAGAALEGGVEVANAAGATLHLLSVVDATSLGIDVRTDVQTAGGGRRRGGTRRRGGGRRTEGAESVSRAIEHASSVHGAVLPYVEEHGVDLVVLGTHGRSGFDRYLLGSVTEAFVRTVRSRVDRSGPATGGEPRSGTPATPVDATGGSGGGLDRRLCQAGGERGGTDGTHGPHGARSPGGARRRLSRRRPGP